MSTGNLKSYQGSYTLLGVGGIANLTFTGEDIGILFTTTTSCKVRIKIDSVIVDKIEWNGSTLTKDATLTHFELSDSSAPHSLYDGVDPATGENPSILRLFTPLSYASHTLEIEVTTGTFKLEGVQIYKTSPRNNVRDIDTTITGAVNVELDTDELRNDIVVTGAIRGLFQQGGLPVNPNNPLYIRTYSRAVDLGSIYDMDSNDYIGLRVPFEIFNDRILDQDRADHIAVNALKSYRKPESQTGFPLTGDPRLEIFDPIGFTEKKLNTLPEDDRVWVNSIRETMTDGKYVMEVDTMPREPVPSYTSKEEPDIELFDNEPLINIQIKSQGKRITGSDASLSGDTITIANDPGWTTDMWVDYKVRIGQDRVKITANTSNTLTVDSDSISGTPSGNWAISFDPFDTEQKGAPLEIHYDQVINGKVQIMIKDESDKLLVKVNEDDFEISTEWGSGKVYYWGGSVTNGYKEGKDGYLISEYSVEYDSPLRIVINFIPDDIVHNPFVIESTNTYDGALSVNGVVATQSSLGSLYVHTYIQDNPPLVKIKSNRNYANNIRYWGQVESVATNGSGKKVLTLNYPQPNFTTDEYQGYLLMSFTILHENAPVKILSNTANTITLDATEWTDINAGSSVSSYEAVIIIGQGNNDYENLIHDHFKSSDNNSDGLKITASEFFPSYPTVSVASGYNDTQVRRFQITQDFYTYWFSMNGNYYKGRSEFITLARQYIDRDIYIARRTKESGGSFYPMNWIPLLNNYLIDTEFLINADLTVFYIPNGKENIVHYANESQFIKSQTFISLKDWSFIFKPEHYSIGEEKKIPQWGEGKCWAFLFNFSFIDRAGRYVQNSYTSQGATVPVYNESKFPYVVFWMPEDSANKTASIFRPNNILSDSLTDDLLTALMTHKVTIWT
ncbi:MAG: hypothetical protein GWP19_00620 [Planctomycetia bacterium]|nr:hypothetical protein [Planctomycetia bacterium]